MEEPKPDKQVLIDIITTKMPFGKHAGTLICDLPENYLLWFQGKGFPKGKLGQLMETVYEIRLNGLESIIYELKKRILS